MTSLAMKSSAMTSLAIKSIVFATVLAASLPLAACNTLSERAAGGALVSAATSRPCAQYGYDRDGRTICVGYFP